MAGTYITIEIDDRKLRAAIGELLERIADPRPALEEIGEVLVASTKRRFGSETDPQGNRWAPNSQVTLARKRNPKILTEEGFLGDTIHAQLQGKRAVAVGSNLVYAATHQFGARQGAFGSTARGAPIPWGEIPPRPFLGLSDEDGERVLEILRDHLERGL